MVLVILHSTGQLHKGGPNSGLYILLTSDSNLKLAIPDSGYDFATLAACTSAW